MMRAHAHPPHSAWHDDDDLLPLLRELCDLMAYHGRSRSQGDRLDAMRLLVARLTGIVPVEIATVAVVFSRSAQFHLGGAYAPRTEGEYAQMLDQAGLGVHRLDSAEVPHVVLRMHGAVVDVVCSSDWDDRGVMVAPSVMPIDPDEREWAVGPMRYSVSVAYRRLDQEASLNAQPSLEARRLARAIEQGMAASPSA